MFGIRNLIVLLCFRTIAVTLVLKNKAFVRMDEILTTSHSNVSDWGVHATKESVAKWLVTSPGFFLPRRNHFATLRKIDRSVWTQGLPDTKTERLRNPKGINRALKRSLLFRTHFDIKPYTHLIFHFTTCKLMNRTISIKILQKNNLNVIIGFFFITERQLKSVLDHKTVVLWSLDIIQSRLLLTHIYIYELKPILFSLPPWFLVLYNNWIASIIL